MRMISKKGEPRPLGAWRAASRGDLNFGYGLIDRDLRETILRSLVEEQGWLCAYTGRRIALDRCHIEHLKP